jgi:hypothetical protein
MSTIASRRKSVNATHPPALDWPDWTDEWTWAISPDADDARWASEHLSDGYDSEPPADFIFPNPPESDFDRDAEEHEAEARLTNGHLL